jgi:hypothetical protein
MVAVTVSTTRVNSVKNDDPAVIEALRPATDPIPSLF